MMQAIHYKQVRVFMKYSNKFRGLIIAFAAVLPVFLLLPGCSQKNISGQGSNEPAQLIFKMASPLASNWIGVVQLTITGPGILSPIVDTLNLEGTVISGTVDVPTGLNRRLVIEARETTESGQGLVIYRGESIVDIIPNTTVSINMGLYPAVPMVRLAPRFRSITLGDEFSLDLRAYNLQNLTSLTTQLRYARGQLRVDSIVRYKDLPENAFFAVSDSLQYYIIDIKSISVHQPLTDSTGFAGLATIYFRDMAAFDSAQTIDSTDISIWCFLQISGVATIPYDLRFGPSTIKIYRDSIGITAPKQSFVMRSE
ncbi:hypothetical protein TRIP_C20993 [Candidatus Zixiibacteriota bacterium]|nr:hypothetical protein TRIP_C20993 [candidate division Zixibacteria bacterium]